MRVLALPALLLLVAGVAACGNDSPTAPSPPTETPSTGGTLLPTLSSIQSQVFNRGCVVHHGPSDAQAGLDLSEGRSFDNLVDVGSTQVGLDLVTPNDAENSYLIHKLDGRAGIVGARMPVGGPFLTDDQIDVIKQWINDGAQDN